MQKTVIVYESKYGSTEKTARNIGLIMGNSVCIKTSQFKEQYKNYEFFIIASPIYKEKLDKNIVDFVYENLQWLKNKKVGLFCTCSAGTYGVKYLKDIRNLLGDNVVGIKALGGNVILDKLSKEDYDSIVSFYKKIQHPLTDVKMYNTKTIVEFSLKMREMRDRNIVKVPENIMKEETYNFIKSHSSCTLATGYDKRVRSTPLGYEYKNDCVYFITEGGEKFANILENDNVSVSIYDDFKGMDKLNGMQIQGKVCFLENDSNEYYSILKLKGLGENEIDNLPVNLNVLKIHITKIEFLNSKFKKMGYEVKQILEF